MLVTNNTVQFSGTDSTGTGILLTAQASDTGRFGDIPGAVYATLTQNAVSGYATGIGLVSDGDTVFATIGSTSPSDSNTINGIGVVGGSTGILLSGSGVSATIENNSSTIENNSVGIDVAHDATATISGNKFTANAVDLLIEQTAGTITIGDGNAFSGTADYIENLSSENFDLSGDLTTTFGGFNAAQTVVTTGNLGSFYAVEDKLVDAIDAAGLGFIRINAGNVFVTPNSFLAPATDDTGAISRRECRERRQYRQHRGWVLHRQRHGQ